MVNRALRLTDSKFSKHPDEDIRNINPAAEGLANWPTTPKVLRHEFLAASDHTDVAPQTVSRETRRQLYG
jgi:hypothetical protein